MSIKEINNEKGIGLVETILALGISVVVITALVSLAVYTLRASQQSKYLLEGSKLATEQVEILRLNKDNTPVWTDFKDEMDLCLGVSEKCSASIGAINNVNADNTENITLSNGASVRRYFYTLDASDVNIVRVVSIVEWDVGAGPPKKTTVISDITNWEEFMKSATKLKNTAGYTLIELLIVIGLIGLTIGVTGDIILTLVRSYAKTQATNEIERSANFVVSKIEKEFKNATGLYQPTTSTTVSFYTKYYNDTATYPVSYRYYHACPSDTVNVGCIQRCAEEINFCTNPGDWKNVTDTNNVVVGLPTGESSFFENLSAGGAVESLALNFRFTKNITGATNNPFSGELVVKTTVVAKGTY